MRCEHDTLQLSHVPVTELQVRTRGRVVGVPVLHLQVISENIQRRGWRVTSPKQLAQLLARLRPKILLERIARAHAVVMNARDLYHRGEVRHVRIGTSAWEKKGTKTNEQKSGEGKTSHQEFHLLFHVALKEAKQTVTRPSAGLIHSFPIMSRVTKQMSALCYSNATFLL